MNTPISGAATDTTPPTVTATTPTNSANGFPVSSNVTAQFSEALDPATISTATVELRDSNNVLVPATVTYNSATSTVTLAATANLALATSYTARLKGGAAGIKDLADWKTINEELYNNTQGKLLDTATPLARGKQLSKDRAGKEKVDDTIVAWTNIYNKKARVFATTLGHNNDTVKDAKYLDLVTRGLLWSVDKLDEKHLKPAPRQPARINLRKPRRAPPCGAKPFDRPRSRHCTPLC